MKAFRIQERMFHVICCKMKSQQCEKNLQTAGVAVDQEFVKLFPFFRS